MRPPISSYKHLYALGIARCRGEGAGTWVLGPRPQDAEGPEVSEGGEPERGASPRTSEPAPGEQQGEGRRRGVQGTGREGGSREGASGEEAGRLEVQWDR